MTLNKNRSLSSNSTFKKPLTYGWFSVLYVVWWAACPSALERLRLKFYWSRVRFTAAHKMKSNVAHLEVLLWGEYSHFWCHLAIVSTAVQQSTSHSKRCKSYCFSDDSLLNCIDYSVDWFAPNLAWSLKDFNWKCDSLTGHIQYLVSFKKQQHHSHHF